MYFVRVLVYLICKLTSPHLLFVGQRSYQPLTEPHPLVLSLGPGSASGVVDVVAHDWHVAECRRSRLGPRLSRQTRVCRLVCRVWRCVAPSLQ